MEWDKLKPRERTAALLLGAAVFFALYMRFIERPVGQKVAVYKSQIRNSEMQLRDLEAKLPQDKQVSSKVEDVHADIDRMTKQIADMEQKVPSQFNTSALVAAVTELAQEVKLESVKQRIVKEQLYSRIFLEIKFYSTYLDAVRYVAAVEAVSPFVRVEELEILEPVGKAIELGGAPVKLTVSCLIGDAPPSAKLSPSEPPKIELKRDLLSSSAKPAEQLDDKKFVLEGITYDARNPTAIVNGDVYQTGSELGPYKVKRILSDSVVLTDGIEDHVLSLKAVEAVKK